MSAPSTIDAGRLGIMLTVIAVAARGQIALARTPERPIERAVDRVSAVIPALAAP